MTNKLTLTKPIMGSEGKNIKELEFKEPTASLLIKYGMPVTGDGEIRMGACFDMLETMSGVQRSLLGQMNFTDTMSAITILTGAFEGVEGKDAVKK